MANPGELLQQAVEHHRGGRLEEAGALYRRVLEASPGQPNALYLLGVIAHQTGKHAQAVELIRGALAVAPGQAQLHNVLGLALMSLDRGGEAEASFREAIALERAAEFYNNLGNLQKQRGLFDDAIAAYGEAIALAQGFADAHYNQGNAYRAKGDWQRAAGYFERAIQLEPGHVHAWAALGQALHGSGRASEALPALEKALSSMPGDTGLHCDRGDALQALGRLEEAISAYREALRREPKLPRAWYSAGCAESVLKDYAAAAVCFRNALEVQPDWPEAKHNLGDVLFQLGQADEALVMFRQAATGERAELPAAMIAVIIPACPAAANQGILDARRAWAERYLPPPRYRVRAAEQAGERAAQGGGERTGHREEEAAEQTLERPAQCEGGRPGQSDGGRPVQGVGIVVAQSAGDWPVQRAGERPVQCDGEPVGQTTEEPSAPLNPEPLAPRPGELPAPRNEAGGPPVRIGYLSSFFHRDNWMKPVWGLINQHGRRQFEIHLFSDGAEADIRHGYRRLPGDRFHDISGLSNQAAADVIEAAGIEVLIDLNGYSSMRRLPLLALRPASKIVAWFNMFATSGMSCYDCLVGDDCVIPPEEERFYCERIVRVPGSYLAFDVNYPVPAVAAPPCLTNCAITFGCLAPQYKITSEAVRAWSAILERTPHSKLILRNTAMASPGTTDFVRRMFEKHDIPPERVGFYGPLDHYQFLKTYDEIDIALDTFPYNGGTTTTEAIWQGVPVVTFHGDRWVSRTSASILRAANLGEFVAGGLDGYIELAVRLATSAGAFDKLLKLRRQMRARLLESPVCDARALARSMEALYLELAGHGNGAREIPS